MDGWTDGRMDGWTDGWMDGWMEWNGTNVFIVTKLVFGTVCETNILRIVVKV